MAPTLRAPLLFADLLRGRPGLVHGFTTRRGATTQDLDLGDARGRPPEELYDAWRQATAALDGRPEQVALLRQVHGARVVEVAQGAGPHRVVAEADAAITNVPGVLLAVRTADCVPVLLAASGAVAAVHAGWRGIVAGVVPAAVRALSERAGVPPSSIVAAIGPHASVEGYETGPEVVDALVATGLPRERIARMGPSGREHSDLGAAVDLQLLGSGVKRTERVAGCTLRDAELFSHRRGQTGRQAAIIGLRDRST